ncbi:sodium/glutamate symporter [Bacillus massilinigeriensis]|uniref:sodium/glutamate symporter n=1 Tax=Bacillus mediterraneensis TaxID=1805474 RepID=UPI001F2B45E0|nr:sodium/glutamate symporter [Bacillus mediterraneensis]
MNVALGIFLSMAPVSFGNFILFKVFEKEDDASVMPGGYTDHWLGAIPSANI